MVMYAGRSCCRVCSSCFYSCSWNSSKKPNQKHGCCWLSIVVLVSLLSLCWMYVCLITFNDREDVNWKLFTELKLRVNWFMVLVIVYAVISCYCLLLLVFALIQVFLGEQLDLHWLHKIFLIFGLVLIVSIITVISVIWGEELPTITLSLQATAPFLQFGAVGALTLLSWFVFQCFHRTKKGRSKFLIAVLFGVVSAAIFLCPYFIESPCLIARTELPEKPKLIGHRGAPMLAPENTMMSFSKSMESGVMAFETDVQVSKDGIPFLMHDHKSEFLRRTTNYKKVLPDKSFNFSADITWKELQTLNAGEWFVEADPFNTVSQLSEEEKQTARNQSVPSLRQLLSLAQKHNISVLFDLYSPNQENDAKVVIDTILNSGINPNLILWLLKGQDVNPPAPDFIYYYSNATEMESNGGKHLNVKYNLLETQKIRELRSKNVSVNLWTVNERWLFSLLWCAGASSVTTNACHLLKDMERPDWTMKPGEYQITWILVDVVSLLIMVGLYFIQRKREEKENCCMQQNRASYKLCRMNDSSARCFPRTGP